MQQDQLKWDARFSNKAMQQPSAPGFIVDRAALLPKGRALDVACGDGAAALFLAGKEVASEEGGNRDVLAVDISSEGLKRLEQFAAVPSLAITCVQIDLDDLSEVDTLRNDGAGFGVINISHFKPSFELLRRLMDLLSPGGHLLLSSFNQQQHENNGFSKRFCLEPEQYLPAPAGFECLLYQSVVRGESYMDDYCFIRLRG